MTVRRMRPWPTRFPGMASSGRASRARRKVAGECLQAV